MATPGPPRTARLRWRLRAGREPVDRDIDSNLAWNRRRWGHTVGWKGVDAFGYRWGGGHSQAGSDVSRLADTHLRPFLADRYDLKILEISPGAGRFTAELIRYARELILVDMNASANRLCRERFRYYPTPVRFVTNDGRSLDRVADTDIDLCASFDSMVHMHPEIVRGYVSEAGARLVPGGILWLDHSGRGEREVGHRTAVTSEWMAALATELGLEVLDQQFRNDWDCISVLRKPERP